MKLTAPLMTHCDRESAHAFRVTYFYDDGTEVSTLVTVGDDGAEGDAPDEVLAQVERSFARYGHKSAYTGAAL